MENNHVPSCRDSGDLGFVRSPWGRTNGVADRQAGPRLLRSSPSRATTRLMPAVRRQAGRVRGRPQRSGPRLAVHPAGSGGRLGARSRASRGRSASPCPTSRAGVYTLRIEFADVQKLSPPRFVVTLGDRTGTFQLAPGGGDASLTNPACRQAAEARIAPARRLLPAGGQRDPPGLRRGLLGAVRRDHAAWAIRRASCRRPRSQSVTARPTPVLHPPRRPGPAGRGRERGADRAGGRA